MNESVKTPESALSKRRLGWAGLAAFLGCAACCALPLLAVAGVGSGAAATLTRVLQPGSELVVGGVVFALAIGIMAFRGRSKASKDCGTACNIDATCCDRGADTRTT